MTDTAARPAPPVPRLTAPALIDAARQVAVDLATRAERHDREGSFAPENIEAIWAAGLGNLTLPAEHGGAGADLRTACRVVEELATGDPSTALIFVMHQFHLGGATEAGSAWPDHLRDRLIDDSRAGPALINALRVEPELGTPARGGVPATTAVRDVAADGRAVWRVSGRKIYSTGSLGLRWMAVWGATAADDVDGQRVGFFLVPADAAGIEIDETWDHLGMRASASHDVIFRDVEIPIDHAIGLAPAGTPGRPDPAQLAAGAKMTLLLLSIYLGVGKAGRDWLAGYLNDRKPSNLGASLATLPRFQAEVGEIEALIYTSDQLITSIATAVDLGGVGAAEALRGAPLAKVVVTGNIIRALEKAVALIGNPGLSRHHPLQRHYRDALCSRIHTPQDDVILTGVGKTILGQ